MARGEGKCGAAALLLCGLALAAASVQADGDHQSQEVSSGAASQAAREDAPHATVAQGRLRGTLLQSRGGRPIYAFLGIPYAKPPLGTLRFQDPVAAGPWEGVLNATTDASPCVQKNYLMRPYPVSGSEDCLFLNVYTPKHLRDYDFISISNPFADFIKKRKKDACYHTHYEELEPSARLPVIVYIHGGGFFAGTGASYLNGPQYLLDHDVVLVTLNYRLGALGFLSSGDERVPGNAGLKDQVLALRWVRRNVEAFGGDPRAVTIMGQSAGAVAVHLHMISPLSRGLFQRAVSLSGWALGAWAAPRDPAPVLLQQAQFMDCNAVGVDDALACLRAADAYQLTESGHRFHFWDIDPLTVFRPVVEARRPGAFLVEDPAVSMQMGDFAHVPWLTGAVTHEGIIRALPILSNATLVEQLHARWTELMPRLMDLEQSAPARLVPALWANVSRFYFGDAERPALSLQHAQPFIDLYTDRAFLHSFVRAAQLHVSAGHKRIFLYEFAFRGKHSYSEIFAGDTQNYGVSHCDDLLYLLYAPALFPEMPAAGSADEEAMYTLTRLWTNFATYGNPTPSASEEEKKSHPPSSTHTGFPYSCPESDIVQDGDQCWSSVEKVQWSPYEPLPQGDMDLTFLRIESAPLNSESGKLHLCMRKGLHTNRVNFWRSLPISENKVFSLERFLIPLYYLISAFL